MWQCATEVDNGGTSVDVFFNEIDESGRFGELSFVW